MQISELIHMLEEIKRVEGDIAIRCGQYRIGGVLLYHTAGITSAALVQKRVGSPVAGLPPFTGKERRKTPKRRWDDN